MSYSLHFVNPWQTAECRKAKYAVLRLLGFSSIEADRFRAWRLIELKALVGNYFYSIGKDPQEARNILQSALDGLEDPELSRYK